MFLKGETYIIIGQLILIVILSLGFSMTSFTPLNNNNLEGFEYTGISTPTIPKDDVYALNSINNESTDYNKVGGFNGIFTSPSSQPQSIDIYSKAKGDISCDGLGYFNSRGPLCLDENMKRMLSTRGTNTGTAV